MFYIIVFATLVISASAHGASVVVTGWGVTKPNGNLAYFLQQVTVQIVGRTTCKKSYGNQISNYMICAGVSKGGKGACTGDSGGPLVGKDKLVGIASWGYGCAEAGFPGVYTHIGALRKFIKEKTGI